MTGNLVLEPAPAGIGMKRGDIQMPKKGEGERPPEGALAYTVEQAATLLQVDSRTVRAMIARGDLRCVRVGRLIRVPAEAIAEFLRGGKEATGGREP